MTAAGAPDDDATSGAPVVRAAPVAAAAIVLAAGPAPGLDAARRDALHALLVRRAEAWAAAAAPGGAVVVVAPDDVAAALARLDHGPVLIVRAGCPRLGPEHAEAALADLADGCDVVFGATLEGGWYLAGLREPRPELLAIIPGAAERFGGIGGILERARAQGASVGMLRHERMLATPGDAAALLADPLLDAELRAVLSGA